VYRYLRARTPHEADAADLTQAVFLRALDVLPRFQGSRGTFAAWLFTLARNMATDFGRRGSTLRHEALSAALHVAGPQVVELEVLRRDDAATLQRALATLPPRGICRLQATRRRLNATAPTKYVPTADWRWGRAFPRFRLTSRR
jgi:RNA polymerase sigma-70 factor, ECF subfamily